MLRIWEEVTLRQDDMPANILWTSACIIKIIEIFIAYSFLMALHSLYDLQVANKLRLQKNNYHIKISRNMGFQKTIKQSLIS